MRPTDNTVAVVGTGYVGLTTGACLAQLGSTVTCVDIDVDKIERLRLGHLPIVEAGLAEIVRDMSAAGRLHFSTDPTESVSGADVVFLCVPTPQDDDGSADLSYVEAAAASIGPALKTGAVVVNKSTVPVGSFHVVSDALDRTDVDVVSNPEFLREGTAVHDFLNPDRVVIGAESDAAAAAVRALYESLDTEFILTDPASAETIKYAANGFLAMKVSFVNSVAAMCEQVGADISSVVAGIGSDHRIGSEFLKPGPGWGGSCFPKDSRALVAIAADHGYDFSLMRGVIDINEQQYERMVHKIISALGLFEHDRLSGRVVGALGLTFKAGTDDLRESPSLRILDELRRHGAAVQAYDPTTTGELNAVQRDRLAGYEVRGTAIDAATGADAVVVLTEWPEFEELDLGKIADVMRGDTLVDCRNLLDPGEVRAAGLDYDGVGRR
ncbi:MAG: UDP-glucose/GDP-mannose dehydrogenase family protein [Ilumatobacter sp.]|uniref:UDP-glucose dehydrogenase family protein n=1 Tax=Ilumatobacter sp. TaxID=1967498 RepID=UPI002639915A|nr:UDP-glucose/GDP-mannose dehydrogenase family protein [Ilumatobacter sp.]MDJ0768714.1 UDP-glucose/GDP-mannose dehydrogenase family protein [Ilumatobacter sp.]